MGSGPRTLLCQIYGIKTKDSVDDGPKMSTKGAVKKTIINTKSKIWYNP